MRHKLLIFGFLSSIAIIVIIGIYTLNLNHQTIRAFGNGEEHFKAIATAAAEISSYSKRAEGHLLMYLALHRKSDKEAFPQRIASLDDQIAILDQNIKNSEARTIFNKIKSNTDDLLSAGNTLIAYHDKAMEDGGEFEIEEHREAVINFYENTSAIRRVGVELAKYEIRMENDLKQKVLGKITRLRFFLFALIALASGFTVYLGIILTRMIKSLNKEIANRIQSEELLQLEKSKLEDALSRVEILSGLLPICASCKKIRDDKGNWNQIESYIRDHSEVEFSHGICPDCEKNLYPEYHDEEK